MADNLGRKPIAGIAQASERRHPTRLPILVCRRKPVPQIDGAVMTNDAADEANAILEADRELTQRRADLEALSRLLTAEARRLNGGQTPLPAQISRTLAPADRQLTRAGRNVRTTDRAAATKR